MIKILFCRHVKSPAQFIHGTSIYIIGEASTNIVAVGLIVVVVPIAVVEIVVPRVVSVRSVLRSRPIPIGCIVTSFSSTGFHFFQYYDMASSR